MKTIAVSGYFNPVHKGHIEMFNQAKTLGDKLVVILNSDYQVKLKGSVPFMDENERQYVVSNLKDVDEVIISIDKDKTVCQTLELIMPDIFANGGDRLIGNTPEQDLCERLGIETVYGIGGGKSQSSSTLIKNAIYREERPWGYFEVLHEENGYKVKKLHVNPHQQLSLQSHKHRDEMWYVVNGQGIAYIEPRDRVIVPGGFAYIPKNLKHRLSTLKFPVEIIEIQTGLYLGEDDIQRFSDIYGRK